ncbi:MAG: glycerol-3-phosphate acyltransferase [Actinobacteria bacterium]|nr:glycerol-3-phosphate acyltransferase [Actinomycetota bacterium]
MEALLAAGYLVGAFLVGSIPFSYLTAKAVSGADLRRVGTGTVSGTGVGESSGFWPMALAGLLDIGKGAAAVVPMAGSRPLLAAFGAGAAAAGHNWSPFLRGAGGRAISVAGGACLAMAWPGAVILALGLGVGRLCRLTGLGCFVAQAALPAGLALTAGWPSTVVDPAVGAVLGAVLVGPMWLKRVLGNDPRRRTRPGVYLSRLLFDNDTGWPALVRRSD